MKTKRLALITFVFLSLCTFAQKQEKRFEFELNTGLSLATEKLGNANLKPGFGFEGSFHYRFMPHLGAYAGWGWNSFNAKKSFAGTDVCFEETGYVLGLQFKHPMGDSPISYFLRVAGLYNHIETENIAGEIINDTKHGLGFQVAGGVDIPLGSNWSLRPGVKFNSLSREIDPVGGISKIELSYLSFRMGIIKSF